TFFSLNRTNGTSLFWPSLGPTSTQPVDESCTWSARVRSTVGAHAAAARNETARKAREAMWEKLRGRIPRILEHLPIHPLDDFVARNLIGAERGQVGSLQANHHRLGVVVGRSKARLILNAPGRNRQPLIVADAKGVPVVEHRFGQCLHDFFTIGLVRVFKN